MIRRQLLAALAALMSLPRPALAQPFAVRHTSFQRTEIAGNPALERIRSEIVYPPGAASSRHFHHGTEHSTILEGRGTLAVEGAAPRMLSFGESFVIPAGLIHNFTADITGPARVLAVWVVDRGKPLTERVS